MARRRNTDPNTQPERPPKTEGPRLFIAAPLPVAVVDHVGHLLEDLSSRDLPVRWTAANGLHLTFHFLGDTTLERAELLRMSLAKLAPQIGQIRLRTGKLGVFPNQKRPRVLYIGLDGQTDRLTDLHKEIAGMLDRLGFPVEMGKYRPHLTLGRARDTVDKLFPYQVNETFAAPSVQEIVSAPVDFAISEVRLYRSHLERSGAHYETLATVPL